jgi:hypothetical protein
VTERTTIYAKHFPYDDGHLASVMAEMELTGPPTIRVSKFRDSIFALEGSHRLAACHALGLEPKLVVLEHDCSDTLDAFFYGIRDTLPKYEFVHVHILEVSHVEG